MEFLREGGKVISSYKLNCVQIYGGQPNEKKQNHIDSKA